MPKWWTERCQESMTNDRAFLTASVSLAEIQRHRTADCLRPSGIIKSTELETHQAINKDGAPGGQLVTLASFSTSFPPHFCFQPSGWAPGSTTGCSTLPPATALLFAHPAPCCVSSPGSPTAPTVAYRNTVIVLYRNTVIVLTADDVKLSLLACQDRSLAGTNPPPWENDIENLPSFLWLSLCRASLDSGYYGCSGEVKQFALHDSQWK